MLGWLLSMIGLTVPTWDHLGSIRHHSEAKLSSPQPPVTYWGQPGTQRDSVSAKLIILMQQSYRMRHCMDIQQRCKRADLVATYDKRQFHNLTSQRHRDKLFLKEKLKKFSIQMKLSTKNVKTEKVFPEFFSFFQRNPVR